MSKLCTYCNTENSTEAVFCKSCGKHLMVICPKCNKVCEIEDLFCDNCGTPLKTSRKNKKLIWILIGIISVVVKGIALFFVLRGLFINKGEDFRNHDSTADVSKVVDYDGNEYKTIRIGNQLWMAENLRTTHYADGTQIPNGIMASEIIAYWYNPDDNASNKAKYGLLYNWKAVMRDSPSSNSIPSNVQGVCPNGWHVPSNAEWKQFDDFVYSQKQYLCNGYGTDIAKALSAVDSWADSDMPCAVGNDPTLNNVSGFSALPAGFYTGLYYGLNTNADFWSATEYNDCNAYGRYLYYNNADFTKGNYNKNRGFSVRCIKD